MRSFESWILSYLLNSLWQIPLLFAAGWSAARTLAKVGAAAEHRVWVGVLVLQGILPACSALPAAWLRTLFAWERDARSASEASVSVTMGAGTAWSALHLPPALLMTIAIVYGMVSGFFVARFVWRSRKLAAMRRESVPLALTGEAALCWERCLERYGIGDVSIATSQVRGPVTMGLSRKLLLLPVDMVERVSEADLRTVIGHECAHMQRNDFLKNLIYELLSLPANYHPVFWLTRERIMESREVVCDQMAAQIAGRNEYARSLLRLASLLVEGVPIRIPHAIGIFDANAFERRLMKLTEKQNEIRGVRRLATVVACAALGVGTCGSALALHMRVDTLAIDGGSPASGPSAPLTVSAGEMSGNKIAGPNPKYPDAAKKAKIQGTVVLNAVIGKDGSIAKLNVVSGPKELQKPSLDAVREWTYKPYLLNGDPVEVKTVINVVYSLGK